jgi:hypothetical protein
VREELHAPERYRLASPSTAGPEAGGVVTEPATVSLLRWLRRQLAQPLPFREHLEAAVENDDPAEARRLLASVPFSDAQRRYVESLLDAWERERRPRS